MSGVPQEKAHSAPMTRGRIRSAKLAQVVSHRRLILPQLGATGVSARAVSAMSGFKVTYGPVKAEDIPGFLKNGRKATPKCGPSRSPLQSASS